MQEALPGLQQPATPQDTMADEASLATLDMEDANESEEEAEGTPHNFVSIGLPTRIHHSVDSSRHTKHAVLHIMSSAWTVSEVAHMSVRATWPCKQHHPPMEPQIQQTCVTSVSRAPQHFAT